ncbi:dihydroxyacetone kinase subunit DhaL [Methylosoma difficile]
MQFNPILLSGLIVAAAEAVSANAEAVTALDQAIGDGDHVVNLQRGLQALVEQREALAQLPWSEAWQKIGMVLMSTVGGASGSLFGTLFVSMGKSAKDKPLDLQGFADVFAQGVASVKLRGRTEAGEKTMVDVLQPVAEYLQVAAAQSQALPTVLLEVDRVAVAGMASTRDMVATKGRASFMAERTVGHIDAGAKTSQLMISAIANLLAKQSAPPS